MSKPLGRSSPGADARSIRDKAAPTLQTLPTPGVHDHDTTAVYQIQVIGPALIPALTVEAAASTVRATPRRLLRSQMNLAAIRSYWFDTQKLIPFYAYLSNYHRGQVSTSGCLSPLFDQEGQTLQTPKCLAEGQNEGWCPHRDSNSD
ncbi:MAG: hypothetical protein AAGJ81_06675 [Verrucomicrobiota bacterium]